MSENRLCHRHRTAMASSCFFNQVRDSFSVAISNRRSKAQMCLDKILRTIVSVPPNERLKQPIDELGVGEGLRGENKAMLRGFDIDLNLRLGHGIDVEGSESNGVFKAIDKSSEGECDPNDVVLYGDRFCKTPEVEDGRNGEQSEVIEQKTTEISSEITDLPATSFNIEISEEIEVLQEKASLEGSETKQNYLGLLVEAARLVSGGEFDEDELDESESDKRVTQTVNGGLKRKGDWEVYGDISPVVKSNRGRSQVLPYRYRDSVLEPWKHVSKPQRSSMVSSSAKRRSR